MKNLNLFKVFLVVSLLTFIAFPSMAKESGKLKAIEPFGTLTWSDGIVDVVTKLNNIKGVEKVYIFQGLSKLDVKGITTKEAIEKKLQASRRFITSGKKNTYKGIEGEVYHVVCGVGAFPVMIANIPFTISVVLDSVPGLMTASPEKALKVKGGRIEKYDMYVPLLVQGVYLESTSPALADNFLKLKKIIVKKYKGYTNPRRCGNCNDDKPEVRLTVKDGKGGSFRFIKDVWGSRLLPCKIEYVSEIYRKELIVMYQTHLSKLESEKNKGKENMDSDL